MEFIDYILHIDTYLEYFLINYQNWFYVILFCLIFIETGVVVMPFLPGDSLLFATGMLAASFPDHVNIYLVLILLFIAAVLGDTTNYSIGKILGLKLIRQEIFGKRIIKDQDIAKTESFFNKYGAKTIVIARFVPIVRTLAPFVAGISKMHYATFIRFNIFGGLLWVIGLTLVGYFLGNIPIVKDNFEIMVFVIIIFSLLPIGFEWISAKLKHR
ncbi:MAG: VTT domain-containing protein [Weeksellaceae bacterium]|nr:VTT domain-containing protein [Weeksellaceae bacterium]